jgi:hypothetical protein
MFIFKNICTSLAGVLTKLLNNIHSNPDQIFVNIFKLKINYNNSHPNLTEEL